MTATVTTTDNEADLRVAPGDGRLNPVNHIVRIVVVRARGSKAAKAAKAAGQREGHSHGHGLTDEDRETAKAILMKMPPPSSSKREPMATSAKPKNMFEALRPTDIVVVGREPASVRPVERDGKQKSLDLHAHDDRNKDTVLRVWTESDTIEYQCDEKFEILKVEKAGWRIYGAPDDPFGVGGPYRAQQTPRAQGEKPIWVWRSGLLPARANNQQYKMTFRIGGVEIDPDVACGDPPPR
jgi:hypothetical protein